MVVARECPKVTCVLPPRQCPSHSKEGQGVGQHLCLLILTQAMAALEEAEGVANTAHVLWPWVGRTGSGGPDLGALCGSQAALGAPLLTHLQPDSLGPLNRFQDL